MSGWPSVTAVVPTVDRPELLRRAVRSIVGQDYPGEVECVVVLDRPVGSPLPLLDVELPERRTLRTAHNTRPPGLAGNRNTGYLLAGGELVASCDDDDEWLPHKLTAQVELLRAHPEASVCATGIYLHHRGRDILRRGPALPLLLADLLRDRHMEVHPSSYLVQRQRLLSQIGLVDEQLPGGYAEDYEWLLRAARVGPVVSVPEPLVRVHWHDSSFFAGRWVTIDEALTYLLARVPEFADEPAGLARIEGQRAFANAALGHRRRAVGLAVRSLRRSRRARQSYAALVVALGLVSADRVVGLGRRVGRGI